MIRKIVTLKHPLPLTLRDHQKSSVIAIAEHFMVKIDPAIVQRLGIKDGEAVTQIFEDGTGIIKLIFKDTTKNRGQQEISKNPIDQDYRV